MTGYEEQWCDDYIERADVDARRRALLWVTPELLVSVVHLWGHGGKIVLPVIKGLPENYEVVSVNYDIQRNMFAFVIASDEFNPVPEGSLLPVLDVSFRTIKEAEKAEAE